MRIALVSEHASPLAVLGGVDAGGQNVHVAALARGLARRGAEVVVHTRRDDPELPRRVTLFKGVEVDHVDADTSPAERDGIERDIVASADRIVATCTDEAFELMRLGADRSKVHVVPCGVDLEHFTPDGPAEERTLEHRIVYAGRLVPRKGIGNIISALEHVPGCELVVAGGPPP